mmetsp:Transcript_23451/g.67392  ORF Transcript_23451/g.67392 Transcript_23451/m.67392 type:complete len:139 (-) Transcript_23451:593-1009(-)
MHVWLSLAHTSLSCSLRSVFTQNSGMHACCVCCPPAVKKAPAAWLLAVLSVCLFLSTGRSAPPSPHSEQRSLSCVYTSLDACHAMRACVCICVCVVGMVEGGKGRLARSLLWDGGWVIHSGTDGQTDSNSNSGADSHS